MGRYLLSRKSFQSLGNADIAPVIDRCDSRLDDAEFAPYLYTPDGHQGEVIGQYFTALAKHLCMDRVLPQAFSASFLCAAMRSIKPERKSFRTSAQCRSFALSALWCDLYLIPGPRDEVYTLDNLHHHHKIWAQMAGLTPVKRMSFIGHLYDFAKYHPDPNFRLDAPDGIHSGFSILPFKV